MTRGSKRGRKKRVADPLRTLAEVMRTGYDNPDYAMDEKVAFEWYCRMRVIADYIDAEHDRRMESQRMNYRGLLGK